MTLEAKTQRYRSDLAILKEVLSYISQENGYLKTLRSSDKYVPGIPIAHILRKTNLSYKEALKKCRDCCECGLAEEHTDGTRRSFSITQKGKQFIQELNEVQLELEGVNLRI